MESTKELIYVSPTKMNLLKDCPRCFFDTCTKLAERPRGIMSTLPNSFDLMIKARFDAMRALGVFPDEIVGKLYCHTPFTDQTIIGKMRFWKTAPVYIDQENGIAIRLALDDFAVAENGFTPFEYKSRGSKPEDGYAETYYQLQVDLQALALNENGYKSSGKAIFAFYYPLGKIVANAVSPSMPLGVSVFTIPVDIQRAKETVARAGQIIHGERPPATDGCEYCEYAKSYNRF